MQETSIELAGITILEPVTALTDYMITLVCVIVYFDLKDHIQKQGVLSWRLFFLFLGISTFLGGTGHAFRNYLGESNYMIMWIGMQLASCISIFFAQKGSIESVCNNSTSAKRIITAQLILVAIMIPVLRNFNLVTINSAVGFIMVLLVYFKRYLSGDKDKIWIPVGVLISLLTAFVFIFKLSIHRWFNHKDLAHIFILISLFVMYKGVKKLR